MAKFDALKPGILCMSLTPFARDGSLDEGAMRAHVEHLAECGIMGINVAGTGFGEGLFMSDSEVRRVFEVTVKAGKGKIWCAAANLEHKTAQRNIETASWAHQAGMDMVQFYPCDPGHSISPTREMLNEYYKELLGTVDYMPVMLSNNPAIGFEVPHDLVWPLPARYPQVVAFSMPLGPDQVTEYSLRMTVPLLPVGVASLMAAMLLGHRGWHTPLPNLAPRLCKSFFDAYAKGDTKAAHDAYLTMHRLQRGMAPLAREKSIRPVYKAAMNYMSLAGGYSRKPYLPADDAETLKAIARLVDEVELKRIEGFK